MRINLNIKYKRQWNFHRVVYSNSGMRIVPEVCKLRMPAMTENGQRKTCPEDDWQLAYVTSLEDPNLIYVQTENSKKG